LVAVLEIPALTIDEKERRIQDILIEEGQDAVTTGNNVNWRIGRAAVTYAETFAPEATGKELKACLKEFAVKIGMGDNTTRINEFHKVCTFFPPDTQAHFKDVTWARFLVCARHCRDLSHASTILHQYGDAPVAKVREAILGPRAAPKAVAVEFPAVSDTNGVCFTSEADSFNFYKLTSEHPGGELTVTYTYTPKEAA
jgi:hypothetical protein